MVHITRVDLGGWVGGGGIVFVVIFDVVVLSVRDCVGCFLSYSDVVVVQCVRYVYRVSEGAVLVVEGGR